VLRRTFVELLTPKIAREFCPGEGSSPIDAFLQALLDKKAGQWTLPATKE